MKNLTTASEINLLIIFSGSLWFLVSSLRPGQDPRERQQQTTAALTGLLGLLSGGLDLCWDLGLLRYSSAAAAVYFARHLLRGILVAMLVPIFFPKGTKLLLVVSGTLVIAFNLFAITHYDLRHLPPACLFSLANGFFIGVSIPSAIFLRLEGKRKRGSQNGDGMASIPGATTGKEG